MAKITTEQAAEALLSNYQGGPPSAGDVIALKEKIGEILVKDFGVSAGNL